LLIVQWRYGCRVMSKYLRLFKFITKLKKTAC